MGGWGEPRGTGTTSEVDAAHKLLDGAGIPTGVLASRIEEALLANRTVDGRRLTWRELYELEHEQRVRVDRWATLVSDLDRCEHGRHEGDVCGGCGGPSKGNPLVARVDFFDRVTSVMAIPDRLVGFSMDGVPIIDPGRERRHDPDAWYQR